MRTIAATIALGLAVIIGSIGAAFGLVQQSRINHQQSQITRLAHQLRDIRTALNAAEGSINGEHRNLITCTDVQGLLNGGTSSGYYGINDVGSAALGGSNTIPLPAHCINR